MKNKITRRQFISKCVQTTGAVSAGMLLSHSFAGKLQAEAAIPDIVKIQGEPLAAVEKAFELLGGVSKFIQPNSTVILKPNVSFPNPKEWGSTTNPAVVKAVAEVAIKAGAKRVLVIDHTMRASKMCFKRTGIESELNGMANVKLLSLDRETVFVEEAVPDGHALKSVKIAKLLKKADLFINLPCAKSHVATDVSFGLKNFMGLVWDRTYFHEGTDLHTAIAELATVIRPQLTIMDATRGLVTNGPTGPGKVQEFGAIIAGTDPLAVDAFTVSIANWNNRTLQAQSIKHLEHAVKIGVGEINLEKMKIENVSA